MNNPRTSVIDLVVPDSGPLISLARADALDLLLVFRDDVRLVITDYVNFEATRASQTHEDAKKIQDFLEENSSRVQVAQTPIGELYIDQYKRWERYKTDQNYKSALDLLGDPPPKVPRNLGEESILSFVRRLPEAGPEVPTLILAEDAALLNSSRKGFPGNAAIISTLSFLEMLESEFGLSPAKEIWQRIREGRNANQSRANIPADQFLTDSKSAIDPVKVARFSQGWGYKTR